MLSVRLRYGIPFVETSAYLGENVNEACMVAICLGLVGLCVSRRLSWNWLRWSSNSDTARTRVDHGVVRNAAATPAGWALYSGFPQPFEGQQLWKPFFLQVTQALLELDVKMGQRLLYDTLQQTNIDIGNSTIPSFCSRSFPRGN